MGTRNRRFLGLLVAALLFLSSYSAAVKIASWNLLQYPGTTGVARHPDYRNVIKGINPDVLVVQEMASLAGMNQFLNSVMNSAFKGKYAAGHFFDGPDSDNAIYYNKAVLSLVSHKQIKTVLRDVSEYVLKITSGPGAGTTFRIYSVHLKDGETAADKVQRANEALILRDYLNSLPANSLFMICGDLNLYSNAEKAFINLTGNESDNDGKVVDPANKLGAWHDKASFSNVHTESTRKVQFGGGASGGMDDRFDFILISPALKTNTKLAYKAGSYMAYGNDGKHFNVAVNKLPNIAVTIAIADSLYKASDHLPVVVDLEHPTLNAPSDLVGKKVTPTQIRLSWKDNSTNETGFKIERKVASIWTEIATVRTNSTTYQDKALATSTTYYYRVRAYSSGGSSFYSNTVSVILTPTPQIFSHNWTASLQSDNSYMDWQYIEYVAWPSKLGRLQKVEILISITASDLTPGDTLKIRSAFFTGWNPAEYQYYLEEQFPCNSATLQITRSILFTDSADLQKWIDPLYGPNGNEYMESTTSKGGHHLSATVKLIFHYI